MDNKFYKLMNWPEIESVVYSEAEHPERILGCHQFPQGFLIQCFFPGSDRVFLYNRLTNEELPMEKVDEEGFYALLYPGKTAFSYYYIVEKAGEIRQKYEECYSYIPQFWGTLSEKLDGGILYEAYRYFGAHFCERKGVLGTEFITYAPGALRVSVVGSFNDWDGRIHQMCRITDSGVFAIFIPGLTTGSLYKYEIKLPNSLTYLKRDPFSRSLEKGPFDACAVVSDDEWETPSKHITIDNSKMCLGDFSIHDLFNTHKDVRNVTNALLNECKNLNLDGCIINDITECRNKDVTDKTVSLMCPDPEILDKDLIKELVQSLHSEGIFAVISLNLSSYSADEFGLKGFDGTSLYGNDDKLIDNGLTFNFESRFLKNYLISVCDYYVKILGFDGVAVLGTDRIMYLDYGKSEHEWTPNIYGGNENVGGFDFLKHLNSILHKRNPGIITISGDSYASNFLTSSLEEGGAGFDYKIDCTFDTEIINYLSQNSEEKSANHSDVTNSFVNIFNEEYIVTLPVRRYTDGEKSVFSKSVSNQEDSLKLLNGLIFSRPGSKLIFSGMGYSEEYLSNLQKMIEIYKSPVYPADNSKDSFEWLDAVTSEPSVMAFARKNEDNKLLCFFNFSDEPVNYCIGVNDNEYKLIFDSKGVAENEGIIVKACVKRTAGKTKTLTVDMKPMSYQIYCKMA